MYNVCGWVGVDYYRRGWGSMERTLVEFGNNTVGSNVEWGSITITF